MTNLNHTIGLDGTITMVLKSIIKLRLVTQKVSLHCIPLTLHLLAYLTFPRTNIVVLLSGNQFDTVHTNSRK